MSMIYTWKVTGIKIKDGVSAEGTILPQSVCQTYWSKTGVDDEGNEGTFSGATPFTVESIPEDSFVPFEELTEELVLSWIKSVVVDSYEAHVNGAIAKQIADKGITDHAMPWAPPAETPTPPTA